MTKPYLLPLEITRRGNLPPWIVDAPSVSSVDVENTRRDYTPDILAARQALAIRNRMRLREMKIRHRALRAQHQ